MINPFKTNVFWRCPSGVSWRLCIALLVYSWCHSVGSPIQFGPQHRSQPAYLRRFAGRPWILCGMRSGQLGGALGFWVHSLTLGLLELGSR